MKYQHLYMKRMWRRLELLPDTPNPYGFIYGIQTGPWLRDAKNGTTGPIFYKRRQTPLYVAAESELCRVPAGWLVL